MLPSRGLVSWGLLVPLEHQEGVAKGPLALTQCCMDAHGSRDAPSRGKRGHK